MNCHVYIWRPRPGNAFRSIETFFEESDNQATGKWLSNYVRFGHAAIGVARRPRDPLHDPYMSFWPSSRKPGGFAASLTEDTQACGSPDAVITLQTLDAPAMQRTFEAALERRYHPLRHNCCTVAVRVLDQGFLHGIRSPRGVAGTLENVGDRTRRMLRAFAARPWETMQRVIQADVDLLQGNLAFFDPGCVESIARWLKQWTG